MCSRNLCFKQHYTSNNGTAIVAKMLLSEFKNSDYKLSPNVRTWYLRELLALYVLTCLLDLLGKTSFVSHHGRSTLCGNMKRGPLGSLLWTPCFCIAFPLKDQLVITLVLFPCWIKSCLFVLAVELQLLSLALTWIMDFRLLSLFRWLLKS